MAMNLRRDYATGKILNHDQPICLRGGHFHLFKGGSKEPIMAFAKGTPLVPFTKDIGNPLDCSYPSVFDATVQRHTDNPWATFLDKLNATECNLVRIWLTNGSEMNANNLPTDIYPFLRHDSGSTFKWKVKEAVENGQWNENYFTRLKNFVNSADEKGVAVQISLFNYADLDDFGSADKFWTMTPYNPDKCFGDVQWANDHLVYKALTLQDGSVINEFQDVKAAGPRQKFFTNPIHATNPNLEHGLLKVQKAFVKKVVQTLSPKKNVIFEVMNEPRAENKPLSIQFTSRILGFIFEAAGEWRPLVSMNASKFTITPKQEDQKCDFEWWNSNKTEYAWYGAVDLVSFHSLTGYNEISTKVCNNGTAYPMSCTDRDSIANRINSFREMAPTKALILCTDAVKAGPFRFKVSASDAGATSNFELELRDGQFVTNFANNSTENADMQRRKGDLQNWASWIFQHAKPTPGWVHFQNHSFNITTFDRIKAAWDNPL